MDFKNWMINIFDDDIKFANTLKNDINIFLENRNLVFVININPKEIQNNNYICLNFIDIEMPLKNGFQIADSIYSKDKNAKIIFISNHDKYVFESYDFHAIKYLQKSNFIDQLDRLFDRIMSENFVYYTFSYYDTIVTIPLQKIIYINKHVNRIEIITEDKLYKQSNTIKSILLEFNKISNNMFIQINQSEIANMLHIKKYAKNQIHIDDKTILYVSKNYQKIFKDKYYEYIFFKGNR